MRTALLLLAVGGCGRGFWWDVPGARVNPVGPTGWELQVGEAVGVWTAAVGEGCPAPFIISLGDGSAHRVALIDPARWEGDSTGWTHGDTLLQRGWIDVKDQDSRADQRVLVHELGHALGLDHSTDINDIMLAPVVIVDWPSSSDISLARAKLGCD